MEQAVTDRVGERGFAQLVVPLLDRELAREYGGALSVAVLHDLQQISPLAFGHRDQPPVIDHEHVDPGETGQQPRVGSVRACERELVEEPRRATVERPVAVAAGLLCEGTGHVRLADPRAVIATF